MRGFCAIWWARAGPQEYYEKAYLYVQLGCTENLSLSVLDAQRFGVSAIVTDVGGFPEIAQDGKTAFTVSASDPGAAIATIGHLIENEEVRNHVARRA